MKSRWITYRGKRIFYGDYTDYKLPDFEQLRADLAQGVAVLLQEPEDSVLTITDVRRSIASPPVVALFKEAAITTAKHTHKQAVVGVTGLKKILFDAIVHASKLNAKPFGDLEVEEAKQWLVEDD